MAIKYRRPEPKEDSSRGRSNPGIGFPRYSAAPPTRRALTWIIVATALVVILLMITSELTSIKPSDEYVWQHGKVVSVESQDGQRLLRVELPAEGETPAQTYDISLEGHEGLSDISMEDAIRIQVKLDDAGAIKRIIRVERAEAHAEIAEEL